MPFSVRAAALLALAFLAAALLPAGASALTINSPQDGGHTNAADVIVSYSDPDTLINPACALNEIVNGEDQPPVLKTCSVTSADLGALAEGEYHFVVVATYKDMWCVAYDNPLFPDECTSWSTTIETRNAAIDFTVDRTPPTISLTGGPDEGSSSTSATASFGINANDGAVTCKLDGAPFSCTSTAADLTNLTPGAHQVVVTATDQAGNTGTDTRSFTVTAASTGGGGTGGTGSAGGGNPPASGGAAKVTPAITSAPKSAKPGKKIRLGVTCPDGCRIAVAFKGTAKKLTASITVKPGATTVSYSISKSALKAIRKALKSHKKVTAVFTPAGGVAKKVTIKS